MPNKTTVGQLPLTSLGQETRWSYSTILPSPHRASLVTGKLWNRLTDHQVRQHWVSWRRRYQIVHVLHGKQHQIHLDRLLSSLSVHCVISAAFPPDRQLLIKHIYDIKPRIKFLKNIYWHFAYYRTRHHLRFASRRQLLVPWHNLSVP